MRKKELLEAINRKLGIIVSIMKSERLKNTQKGDERDV